MNKKRPLGRPRPGCEDDKETDLEGSKMRVCLLDSCYSGHRLMSGPHEHRSEPADSIKCGVFLY